MPSQEGANGHVQNNGHVADCNAPANGHGPLNGHLPMESNTTINGYSVTNGTSPLNGDAATSGHAHINGHSASNGHAKSTAARTDEAAEHSSQVIMPIAIVGMSVRASGGVECPEDLWELCSKSRSGWSEIPKDRFSQNAYFHPNPTRSGTHNVRGAHFLQQDIANFDAPFFSMTAQEVRAMDPQQRMLLECTYEALENSGIPQESVVGQNVGVFCGGAWSAYEMQVLRDVDTVPPFALPGNHLAMQANRISYHFDLKGPSFTVDTACSSSLHALHLACQSLRRGEAKQAIVAGSGLIPVPDHLVSMSMSTLFNESGRSFSFDHRADSGYGRGEGVACIIIKPLDEALKAGDSVRAIIRNTGTNQDGRTQGITMPNGQAQLDLIRSVYREAGLDPRQTGFVEAHGTGTKVGDPIEAKALHEAFHEGRSKMQPLYIGSIKSNVGHTEAVSGLIAVVKSVLMLEKKFILPNINFEKPNPRIPLADWNMKVPISQVPWPPGKKFVSINNFGFGGANAHVVLERATKPRNKNQTRVARREKLFDLGNGTPESQGVHIRRPRLFVLAANSEKSLQAQMQHIQLYLEQRPDVLELSLMSKLAYTLGQRRSLSMPWKVAAFATSGSDLVQKLLDPVIETNRAIDRPKIAFVMTGQGAQWHAMGRELIHAYPVYKASIAASDEYLSTLGAQWSLLEELSRDAASSKIDEAYISQPACTATQIALTDLLRAWGIRADAVVGHSSGEIACAYAAGILSLEDCMKVSYFRGVHCDSFSKRFPQLNGQMMAIGASEEDVLPLLDHLEGGKVVVACVNSPSSVTVSGDREALDQLQQLAEDKQWFNRRLRVDMAYHSHHMKLISDDYLNTIKSVTPRAYTDIKFFSSVTGELLDQRLLQPAYWVTNLTSPVKFSQAVQDMFQPHDEEASSDIGFDIMLELGPHAALEGPLKQILKSIGKPAARSRYASALIRKGNATETALSAAGKVFVRGLPLDFAAVNFPDGPDEKAVVLTDLPPYPWSRQRYWHEARIAQAHRFRQPRNDILGVTADDFNDLEPRWRNLIRLDEMPWIRDHQYQGKTVYPLAGYVCMAIEAASQKSSDKQFDHFTLRDVVSKQALILEETGETETMLTLRPYNESARSSTSAWDEFRIFSWSKVQGWMENCRGLIATRLRNENLVDGERNSQQAAVELANLMKNIESACTSTIDRAQTLKTLGNAGIVFGPTFQGLQTSAASDCSANGVVDTVDLSPIMPNNYHTDCLIHPTTLDSMAQVLWPILGSELPGWKQPYVPSYVREITIRRDLPTAAGTKFHVYGEGPKTSLTVKPKEYSFFAVDEDRPAEPCVSYEGFVLTPVGGEEDQKKLDDGNDLCYKLTVQPYQAKTEPSTMGHHELVVAASPAVTDALMTITLDKLESTFGSRPQSMSLDKLEARGRLCVVLADGLREFACMNSEFLETLRRLVTNARGVLWVTSGTTGEATGPDSQMVVGFARSVRSESAFTFATLNLDTNRTAAISGGDIVAKAAEAVFSNPPGSEQETELIEENGVLHAQRVVADEAMNAQVQQQIDSSQPDLTLLREGQIPTRLSIAQPGLLNTLRFTDSNEFNEPLPEDRVDIEVKAVGLNLEDVMTAAGRLSSEHLGSECSGVVTAVGKAVSTLSIGDRVCALAEGCFATKLRCRALSAHRISDDISLDVAASIPVSYATACYSLNDLARLDNGESILIHNAASGIGQAAILLARTKNAKILVTVGSVEEKQRLMTDFSILEEDIFFSEDYSFVQGVKRATNGNGVDVVLNSLSGEQLAATWECIADFGRFIEIGKHDIMNNTRLAMAPFQRNVTFASADLGLMSRKRPQLLHRLLTEALHLQQEQSSKGVAHPIVMPMSQVEKAFRRLQKGETTGKTVLRFEEGDFVMSTKYKKSLFRPDGTYIIVGGTGGLGRSLASWMVKKGARHIAILSRSSGRSYKTVCLIDDAAAEGATIDVFQCDVAKSGDVQTLIQTSLKDWPPVRGMIHSAMVLHDVLFEKMTLDQYTQVIDPKVAGVWNLHNGLLSYPLDFFITLSSVSGIIGNRGQAAYAAASTFHNAFVHYRRSLGLPSATIDLGAVSDIGYLAESSRRRAEVMQNIRSSVNEREVHALVEAAVCNRLASCSGHVITGLRLPPDSKAPFWLADPKFAELRAKFESAQEGAGDNAAAALQPGAALKGTKGVKEAEGVVREGLAVKIAGVLIRPVEDLRGDKPISSYGLDSLVAIEIRNWITRELQASLQVLELLSSGNLTNLARIVLAKSTLTPQPVREEMDAAKTE